MKKGKRCLRALPAGYHEVKLYDPKSRSFRLLTGPVSFAVSLLAAATVLLLKTGFSLERFALRWENRFLWHILTILALVLAYTSLHELTHGLVYRLLTGQKLRFGFGGASAWCGVPGIYMKRSVATASCLAPFAVFTAVFLALLSALPLTAFWMVVLIGFMNHLGGCFADLIAFCRMMQAGPRLLVWDGGDEQHFYLPHRPEEKQNNI